MSIERFYLLVFILSNCSNLFIGIQFQKFRSGECIMPILRMDNGGVIQSHRHFRITPYPNKMDCTWVILAPDKHRIMIQFNFLNIEKNEFCNNDYLEFKSSNNISTRFCGSDDRKRYISNENKLFIGFHSDETLTFEGFMFRYLFVPLEINKNNWKTYTPCAADEWECELGQSCIPKSWRCDNIRDCRDNSDENNCNSFRSCHQSQVSCLSGGCLPKEFICNGISDCTDNSDENQCNFNKSFTESFKPSEKNECSYQSISPNFLNNTFDNSQIVGGNVAVPGSWPWIISLRYGISHICAGSLISEQWVVTAAHCLSDDPNPDYYSVDLGRYYLYFGNIVNVQVDKIIIHQSYNNRTFNFDIALLKLKNKVKLSKSVQTVCLPENATDPLVNSECVILGWGYTQGTGGEGILKQAMVSIIDKITCNNHYKGFITNEMICAGKKNGGVDACEGDSGGPLICNYKQKYVLYGIVSFGQGCALPNLPGIYTNVVQFINWIKNNLVENELTSVQTFTLVTTNISHTTKSPSIFSTQITELFNNSSHKFYHSIATELANLSKTTNKILQTNAEITNKMEKSTIPFNLEPISSDNKLSTVITKNILKTTKKININLQTNAEITNKIEKSTFPSNLEAISSDNKLSTIITKDILKTTKKIKIDLLTTAKITDTITKSRNISSKILSDLEITSSDNKVSTLVTENIPKTSISDTPNITVQTVPDTNNNTIHIIKINYTTKNPLSNSNLTPNYGAIKIITNETNLNNTTVKTLTLLISKASIMTNGLNNDSTSTVNLSMTTLKQSNAKIKPNFNVS